MPKLRIHNFSVSIDGYGAGPDQALERPLGAGGERLHEWIFGTRTFQRMNGADGGSEGLDDRFAAQREVGIGATIMGRNMFGPIRGSWPNEDWKGWWGDDPPFHHPVFVLTHHPRPPVPMQGGTTFYFVTDGVEAAHVRALEAAGGKDVILGGGVSTIQQFLRAGLVDEMHLAITPVLLGRGERLFDNLDAGLEGLTCVEFVASQAALHVRFVRA